jgi:hypothetical protein
MVVDYSWQHAVFPGGITKHLSQNVLTAILGEQLPNMRLQ